MILGVGVVALHVMVPPEILAMRYHSISGLTVDL